MAFFVIFINEIFFLKRMQIIRLTEGDLHNIIRNVITEMSVPNNDFRQTMGSSATSINKNKTASGFQFFGGTAIDKKTGNPKWKGEPAFQKGKLNVDIGGGKFDNAHEYINSNFGATNLVFDPFSRDFKHNEMVFNAIEEHGGADSVTCFNCLNVIKEPQARENVIMQCSQVLKPHCKAYFQVYSNPTEYKKGGSRQMGADQWQEFRDIKTYIPEIAKHFGKVTKHGPYLVAEDPLDSEFDAAWSLDSTGENVRYMKRFNSQEH